MDRKGAGVSVVKGIPPSFHWEERRANCVRLSGIYVLKGSLYLPIIPVIIVRTQLALHELHGQPSVPIGGIC
jgi:hypothetical protein